MRRAVYARPLSIGDCTICPGMAGGSHRSCAFAMIGV